MLPVDPLLHQLLQPVVRPTGRPHQRDRAFDLMAALIAGSATTVVGAAVVAAAPDGPSAFVRTVGSGVADLLEVARTTQQGPAMEAIATGRPSTVEVEQERERWPAWAAAATSLGIRSAHSVAFSLRHRVLGAIVAYSSITTVDPAAVATANLMADYALIVAERSDHDRQMERALETRHAIGLAIGILMTRHDLDYDTALSYLKRRSSQENVKVNELARLIVAERDDGGAATT